MRITNPELLSTASRVLVGEIPNHWLYSPSPPLYDLTRSPSSHFPPPSPSTTINLSTTAEPIAISPNLTPLVIVDMQNLFLSLATDAASDSPGNLAKEVLVKTTIPVSREQRLIYSSMKIACRVSGIAMG